MKCSCKLYNYSSFCQRSNTLTLCTIGYDEASVRYAPRGEVKLRFFFFHMSNENERSHYFTLLNRLHFFPLLIAGRICELCCISHFFTMTFLRYRPPCLPFNCVSLISVIAQLFYVSANWPIAQWPGHFWVWRRLKSETSRNETTPTLITA